MSRKLVAVVILIVVAIVGQLAMYFAFNYNADYRYNARYGTYVTIATQSPSLNRTWNAIITFGNHMYEDWQPSEFETTYNNQPILDFNAGLIYENSLAAENDYLIGLNETMPSRIDAVNRNVVGQTEQGVLYDLRNEMNSYGGLDWAVRGAWYIKYANFAYWSGWYYTIYWILAAIVIVLAAAFIPESERQYRSRY